MKHVFAVFALAALPGTVAALDYYRDPRLPVARITATEFEVIERGGAGARDVWCAAARYAVYTLGQQSGRIYIDTPRGPARSVSGAKGVTFTTQAPPNPPGGSVSVTTRVAGANLPVIHALQFCRDYILGSEDRI